MPDRVSTEWKLSHWAGSPAQLAEAVRLAIDSVTALAPYPEGYDHESREGKYDAEEHRSWMAAEDAAKLCISVSEENDYSVDLAGVDELADLPPRSLGAIQSIWITVGAGRYSTPSVVLHGSHSKGLTVEIRGYERSWAGPAQ
jgi:hypothetical protein